MTRDSLPLKPGLYVTATPIGNLGDITYRAVEAMRHADLILCEDTRHTARLCEHYSIKTGRAPYHDHNGDKVRPGIIKKLQDGAAICLVSDAGTPLISDPGFKLVRDARAAGVDVFPLPGANAAIAALSAAGAPSNEFYFAGFPPAKANARKAFFERLAQTPATLIFYETPQRISESLTAMAAAFGDRRVIVARELTKTFEEFHGGNLSELAQKFLAVPPKGEIVIIVDPPEKAEVSAQALEAFLLSALRTASVRDAAAEASARFGVAKKTAYARALELKGKP